MKLSLYNPTETDEVNQYFGGNPDYYKRFLDSFGNPEKGHMGVDFFAPHATPLYAVIDGLASYITDSHGGDGIYIHTSSFDYGGGQAEFNVIYWHLCSKDDPLYPIQIPTDGGWHKVKEGQLIGYSDNTGAPYESSGDHLHFGLMPTDTKWKALHADNGYDGCIDPLPYLNGLYSGKIQVAEQAVIVATQAIPLIQNPNIPVVAKVGLLQALINLLKNIWTQT